MDVQMPELDGFGAMEAIGPGAAPVIVFVTAHDKFALRAFEVHAVDYLLKPFDRTRFKTAVGRALEQVRQRKTSGLLERQATLIDELNSARSAERRLAVKSEGHVVWVKLEEIDWVSSADNYCELHVGTKSHLLRETLGSLEEQLPPGKFLRISRSVIINAGRVIEFKRSVYGGGEILLEGGAKVVLSRRYRDKVKQLGLG